MKIKDRIKTWLLKDELNQLKEVSRTLWEAEGKYLSASTRLSAAEDICSEATSVSKNALKLMNSICDVGADVSHEPFEVGRRPYEQSWAVICVHGKMDYVKFVPMAQSDIRTIVSFLKNFQYSNRCIDTPMSSRYVKDYLLKPWRE